jgi:two-component system cell cycle response regulator
LTLPGRAQNMARRHTGPSAAMPNTPPNTLLTEFDPLATPFDARPEVDLLLHDLVIARDAPSATAAERSTQRGGAGRAVLVVDSTPIARKFLMQRLTGLGFEAHGAENGEHALALIEQQAFAIVFLELALTPENGIDGLSLCQAIKQKPDHPNGIAPAVVVTTGQTDSSDRVRSSLAGCDAYLNKPLIEAEFLAVLREIDPLFR